MTIEIALTPEEERKLTELARTCGTDPATHAHDVVAAYLSGASQSHGKSFADILAPIREGWHQSGMTDAEVDELFESELREARRERRRPSEAP
jgi:hypothetical protein